MSDLVCPVRGDGICMRLITALGLPKNNVTSMIIHGEQNNRTTLIVTYLAENATKLTPWVEITEERVLAPDPEHPHELSAGLMKALGLPPHVIAFTAEFCVGSIPEIDVCYHPTNSGVDPSALDGLVGKFKSEVVSTSKR